MPLDYDLLILGGTPIAREAAIAARSLQARVALVEPLPQLGNWAGTEALCHQAFVQLGRNREHLLESTREPDTELARVPSWAAIWDWVTTSVAALEEGQSPAVLMARGVDVVIGKAEFHRRPHLGVTVNRRSLRSRAYLVARGFNWLIPTISGLAELQPLTPHSLWHTNWAVLPQRLIILGYSPTALELAQTFCRLGTQVTLVTRDRLLPWAEPEAAQLLMAQLEVDGVELFTRTQVTKAGQSPTGKWIQTEFQTIEADEILVAGAQVSDLDGLNLAGVGVQLNRSATVSPQREANNSPGGDIVVRSNLRSTNPRIYGCQFPELPFARQAARVAIRNALFFPWAHLHPEQIPRVVMTDVALASVGLSEAQARHRYGDDAVVQSESFKSLAIAQMQSNTTGFCKLIARRNGELLGIHLVGSHVEDVGAIAILALQTKQTVRALAELPLSSPSTAEILRQTALAWQRQRLHQHPQRDWLEDWHEGRRSGAGWRKI